VTTAYADYTYYTGTYLGTSIATEAEFDQLALRASAELDLLAHDRVAAVITDNTETDLIDDIAMATCAMAEELQRQATEGTDGVKSESVGSHSITFTDGSLSTRTGQTRLLRVAKTYLSTSGLLFQGFEHDEMYHPGHRLAGGHGRVSG
jgi:hypothetical protein